MLYVTPFPNPAGSVSFRASGTIGGVRIRKNFSERAAAEDFAQAHNAAALSVVGPAIQAVQTRLTAAEVVAAEEGVSRAAGRWPLSAVVRAGISALEAAETAPARKLAVAFEDWLGLVEVEVGPRWLGDLRAKGRAFVAAHPEATVADFTRPAVREYLDGLGLSQQTKANTRNALHRFASWLVERGELPANPVAGIRIARKQDNDTLPAVMSANQAEAWLRACERDGVILGWAVLCTFCGLRPNSEAPRLTWAEIDLAAKTLHAMGTKRGQKPRVMPLQPAAVAWLRAVQKPNPPTPGYFSRRHFRSALDDANANLPAADRIEWVEDIQRHTFASMRLAVTPDVLQVAAEMGNSPRVIYAHYRHPRARAEADRFWSLRPE